MVYTLGDLVSTKRARETSSPSAIESCNLRGGLNASKFLLRVPAVITLLAVNCVSTTNLSSVCIPSSVSRMKLPVCSCRTDSALSSNS